MMHLACFLALTLAASHQEQGAHASAEASRQAAILAGEAALSRDDVSAAMASFGESLVRFPNDPVLTYSLARCAARQGEVEAALEWLGRAFDAGYDDPALLSWDPDLASLRENTVFCELLAKATARHKGSGEDPEAKRPALSSRLKFGSGVLSPYSVAVHPKRPIAALALDDGPMRVFDVDTGETLATWQADSAWGRPPAFSPDGKVLATVDKEGLVRIWNPETGEKVASIRAAEQHETRLPWVNVMFSPDGECLLTYGRNCQPTIWNTHDWSLLARLNGDDLSWIRATWSHDGKRIATVTNKGSANIWHARTGERLIGPLENPKGGNGVALRPDGAHLAVAGDSALVRVWDLKSLQIVHDQFETYMFGEVGPLMVEYSPDGKHLLTTSGSGYVWSWSSRDYANEWKVDFSGGNPFPFPAHYEAEGSRVLVVGNFSAGRLLDAADGKTLFDIEVDPPRNSEMTHDGRSIVALASHHVTVLDAETGRVRYLRADSGADGELVITPQLFYRADGDADRHVQVKVGRSWVPLSSLSRQLFDPRKVRASIEGVELIGPDQSESR